VGVPSVACASLTRSALTPPSASLTVVFHALLYNPARMTSLSVREAAAELGVHPARITHWIASGRIRAEWVDGPHGRTRSIDDSALMAMRRELRGPDPHAPSVAQPDPGQEQASPEALSRARAVESYTAGLAATAIAPAISRLVETIERLTRENGDLREEIGALKARLDVERNGRTDDHRETDSPDAPGQATGLSDDQWATLGEKLDRLSQPTNAAPVNNGPPAARDSSATQSPYLRPRKKPRVSPWERVMSWLRDVRV
jgi:hypothetical protein